MKKSNQIIATMMLMLTLTGCANSMVAAQPTRENETPAGSSSPTAEPQATPVVTQRPSETEAPSMEALTPATPAPAAASAPQTTEKPKPTTNPTPTAKPTQAPSVSTTQQKEEPNTGILIVTAAPTPEATESPKETPNPTPTPTQSPTPTPTQPPAATPAPTAPPTAPPTATPTPAFDISTWIAYAQNYAVSVGLNLDSTATACWDNPIVAGGHRKDLEGDIRGRLERYARDETILDVWIWAESRGDGSYDLYVGYA